MPLKTSISSMIRTYNSAMYAARSTHGALSKLKNWSRGKKSPVGPKTNPIVAKVRSKIAARQPMYASRERYYNKTTPAGQARRNQLAKALKGAPRPRRSHTGDSSVLQKKGNQQYPGKITLTKGMTGRQLNRGVARYERRKYIGDALQRNKGNRSMAAKELWTNRTKHNIRPKFKSRGIPSQMLKKASALYHKNFG